MLHFLKKEERTATHDSGSFFDDPSVVQYDNH